MIGLEFEKENINTNFLLSMFKNIPYENYMFSIPYREISCKTNIVPDNNIQILANTFKQQIEDNKDSFIYQLNLQIFDLKDKIDRINNYDDFVKCKCQFILLIVDSRNVEIYIKDNELSKTIIKNIDSMKIKYNIKTIDNDGRTSMNIF